MMTIASAFRFLFTGSEKRRETFKVKTGNHKLTGTLDDKQAMLLLRDYIARECYVRGYTEPIDEDFVAPFDIVSNEERA